VIPPDRRREERPAGASGVADRADTLFRPAAQTAWSQSCEQLRDAKPVRCSAAVTTCNFTVADVRHTA